MLVQQSIPNTTSVGCDCVRTLPCGDYFLLPLSSLYPSPSLLLLLPLSSPSPPSLTPSLTPSTPSLKPLDVEFMKRLHNCVNIVPVIAKADTMTLEERDSFKRRVSKGRRREEGKGGDTLHL